MQNSQNPQDTQPNESENASDNQHIDSSEAVDETIQVAHVTGENETPSEAQPDLEQLLKAAEIKAAEHHDAWMRAKAETENIRKRAQNDVANAHKYAVENFSTELLTVMDSLEAALAVDNANVENYKNGMELTQKQLTTVFNKFNIAVIDPVGEKFDPHQHQAMCTVDSEQEPNTVVQVMQKGYKLHDRVIRPALVMVSKAKDA
ncbi:nucleotide exchange factor GrpE [Nitrosomonas sp.]|uniref:nucleotide exchange factor GrpE n=1 Tax=Nitrosomonas sp. TaxID=42353 RepID=UPI001DC72F48|nr:nucleotide exchange factor GrpE [Nitrosomonas sp.]MCB1948754.1 nucleotide exchange factor GrpE [Nitrosomonas sp.]MCP5243530.1 nucleotide exchange factor GrpE [Burkholderiales bacterium]MDR4515314.1 nucleotide exchange factor GrpE [Nitrosomonas sp.]